MKKILLVEHDRRAAYLVRSALEEAGMSVSCQDGMAAGLRLAGSRQYDLVVLCLSYAEGISACLQLRTQGVLLPVLIVTAKMDEDERVALLEAGADDCMCQPVSLAELTAKVKAMIRRVESYNPYTGSTRPSFCFPDLSLEIDARSRQVMVNGREVQLTMKEFDLLLQLARYPGQVFSRAQLLDSVWGYTHETYEHTVNSHVNRLRTKIEPDPAKPAIICTVWGVGYRFGATTFPGPGLYSQQGRGHW